MRVILGNRSARRRWLPKVASMIECQSIVDALKGKIMLSASNVQLAALMSEMKSMDAPSQYRTRISDLLRKVPITHRESSPPIDLYIDDCNHGADSGILDAIVDSRFELFASQRSSTVLAGTNRDELFSSHFRHYAAAATSVVMLDQYMFINIDKGRGAGALWMLQSCLSLGVSDFTLFSCAPVGGNLERLQAILKNRLKVPAAMHVHNQSIRVTLFAATHNPMDPSKGGDGPLVHDRHIRFFIGRDRNRTTPTFNIGPGFDVFSATELKQSFEVQESLDSRAARAREDTITRSAGASAGFTLT